MAKYDKKSQKSVKDAMHEMKRGKLRSGGSGKKVKSKKQAIAIGLSEARRKGSKAPEKPASKRTTKTQSRKTAGSKKSSGKRSSGSKVKRKK